MKNILFIAPPAGGKGTQSELLVEKFGYVHISTGDLLRDVDDESDLGKYLNELMSHGEFAPDEIVLKLIEEKLKNIDEERFSLVSAVEFKDPTTILLVSLFLGGLGIDRFMLGETGMGVLKLLTGGLCGILTIIDWFGVQKKAKELNFNKLMMIL